MIPGSIGQASHREGKDTLALGDFSHAEGDLTQAQGDASHSEGHLTASIGDASHSEGNRSVSTGGASHAEGHGTISKNYAQHTEGIFNKGESLDTIHETGIGTSDVDRKNVLEMYLDGDVKFPELTFQHQKNGDGTNAVTVNFVFEKEYSVLKTKNVTNELLLDFSQREINFTVTLDSDLIIRRPLNMKRGQSGTIMFDNFNDASWNLSFLDYWFYGKGFLSSQIVGKYETFIIEYVVIDETNIYVSGIHRVTPHLPIQIGGGNYLEINNGDFLVQ